jgi:hypothetical protein
VSAPAADQWKLSAQDQLTVKPVLEISVETVEGSLNALIKYICCEVQTLYTD